MFHYLIIISDVSVHCEYIELADHINVSTYMYSLEASFCENSHNFIYWRYFGESTRIFYNDHFAQYRYRKYGDIQFASQRYNNTCSQHVKASCYFDGFNRGQDRRFML